MITTLVDSITALLESATGLLESVTALLESATATVSFRHQTTLITSHTESDLTWLSIDQKVIPNTRNTSFASGLIMNEV